jgi:two-component system LytT family response regulator
MKPTHTTSVFIVDDEYQSRQVLIKMLDHYFGDIRISGEAATVEEAIAGIQIHQPRLIFLDVQMNGETGFDLLDSLPDNNLEVIFTTAYHEFAVKAFRYSAIDYLVKPIDPLELESATQKAIDKLQLRQSHTSSQLEILRRQISGQRKFTDKIAVPTPEGLLFVSTADIIYCQGQGNYTEIFLLNGQKLTSSHTLKAYEDMLADRNFFRTHKSFLINLQQIESYRKGEGGNVIMSDGREIEIARRNKTGFLNLFKG